MMLGYLNKELRFLQILLPILAVYNDGSLLCRYKATQKDDDRHLCVLHAHYCIPKSMCAVELSDWQPTTKDTSYYECKVSEVRYEVHNLISIY